MLIQYNLKQDLFLMLAVDEYKSLMLNNISLNEEEYLNDAWFNAIFLHRYIDGLYIIEDNIDKKRTLPNHLSKIISFLRKNKISFLYLYPEQIK